MNFPPPWNLNGEGIILPFYANKEYFLNSSYLSDEDKKIYKGGIGSVMLVNYYTSNVGPYYELLLIPGDFQFKNKIYKRITKIFVSSELSIKEGIKNWAIPKELASFDWKKENSKNIIEVKTNEIFFKINFEEILFSFPLNTSIYPTYLLQPIENYFLETEFTGKGKGKLVKILNLESDENIFPNISNCSHLYFGISVNQFLIQFPIPNKLYV